MVLNLVTNDIYPASLRLSCRVFLILYPFGVRKIPPRTNYYPSRPGTMSYVTWVNGPVISTATNMGPITTIFTPPSSCVSVVTMYNQVPYPYLGHYGQGDPACFPQSRPIFDFGGDYFFSPAICPHYWTSLPIPSGALPPQLGSSVLCCPP